MAPIDHITAFEDLWQRVSSERSNILHHPFVLSILTGTLPYSCLTNCLRDESYLLTAVSEVLGNQPVISSSLIKLSSYVQNLWTCSRNEETQKLLADDASDASSQVSVSARKFKTFLLEQALLNYSFKVVCSLVTLQIRKELQSTIASFIPRLGKEQSALQLWISSYANSEMQISVTLLAKEVTAKLSHITLTVDAVTRLQHLISATLVHQLHVLDSASAGNLLTMVGKHSISNPWYPHRLVFTTDYDVTCTEKDTCEILVALAESFLERNSLEHIRDESRDKERLIKRDLMAMYWSLLEIHDQRSKECLTVSVQNTKMDVISVQHEESEPLPFVSSADIGTSLRDVDPLLYIMQPGMDPSLEPLVNIAQKLLHKSAVPSKRKLKRDQIGLAYNDSGLRKVLKLLAGLEKKVNQEIMASGVLRGITRKEIRGAAQKIPLRKGCGEVLSRLVAGGTPVHLISANWSRDLIAGGLPTLPEEKLYVHSNDLRYDPEGVSDGTFTAALQDAFDKEIILETLRLLYTSFNTNSVSIPCYEPHSQNSPFFPPNEIKTDNIDGDDEAADFESKMIVYLGDSPNDLLALLNADLGIVFEQNKALRLLIDTHNVKLLPLVVASAQISRPCPGKEDPLSFRNTGFLFEASSWADVEACLFGHSATNNIYMPSDFNGFLGESHFL